MRNNFVLRWIVPKKRIGRLEFAERMVATLLVIFVLMLALSYFLENLPLIQLLDNPSLIQLGRLIISPKLLLLWLIAFWVFFSWHISRLHDIGKGISGRWLAIILCISILIPFNIDLSRERSLDHLYTWIIVFCASTAIPIVILDALLLTVPGNVQGNRHGPAPEEYNSICIFLFSKIKRANIGQRQIAKIHSKFRSIYGSSLKTKVVCWALGTLVLLGEIIAFPLVSFFFWGTQAKNIDRLLSARSLNRAIIHDVAWAVDMWMVIRTDLSYLDWKGWAPIHYATKTGNARIVEKLLEAGAAPSTQTEKYMSTPLHFAVARHNHNPEVIEILIKAGADPNAQDRGMETPLHGAVYSRRNLDVVKALLEAGADPNTQDRDMETPLHEAVHYHRNLDVIKTLLETGADPNARDADMETPLHVAVGDSDGNLASIKVLLEAGADPNAQNTDMETPLHEAVSNRYTNLDIIKTLIVFGSHVHIKNGRDETPLENAIRRGRIEIIEILYKAGAQK